MASAAAIRAGSAYVEMGMRDADFKSGMDRVAAKFKTVGLMVSNFASMAGTALAGIGAAGSIPAIGNILDTAKLASAADAFGLSADAASRLFGIMGSAGSDVRDATEALVTFNQRVADAIAGVGEEAPKLFKDLGVDPKAFQALDTSERFYALLDALRAVEDPAKRVGLLLKAVGEDSGKNLLPVLGMSADRVRALGDSFAKTDADLAAAKKAAEEYTLAVGSLRGLWSSVVTAITPAIQGFAQAVGSIVKPVTEWVRGNREAVVGVLTVAGAVATATIAVKAFGIALALATKPVAIIAGAAVLLDQALGGAFSAGIQGAQETIDVLVGVTAAVAGVIVAVKLLGAAWAVVTSPALVVVGIVGGLVFAFVKLTDVGKRFASGFLESFRAIGQTFRETFSGIVAAVKKGDLSLAWDILLTGLKVGWLQAVELFRSKWDDFANYFRDVWRDVIVGVQSMWMNFVKSIRVGFLDALIGVVEGVNAAVAKANDVLHPGRALEKARPELAPLEKEQDQIIARMAKEKEKLNAVEAEVKATGKVELHAPTIAALRANLDDLKKQYDAVKARWDRIWERHAAGDKFIDTAPFKQAREEIEAEAKRAIDALKELDKREREARNNGQLNEVNRIRREREFLQLELTGLVKKANAPAEKPEAKTQGGGMWFRELRTMSLEDRTKRFGDAVRGTFQSADYAGTLGIGPASEIAKQQVRATEKVVAKIDRSNSLLEEIARRAGEGGVFI